VAFTATNGLTTIHSCDQITDAVTSCVLTSTAGGSFSTDSSEYVEGGGSYIFDLDIETLTVTFTPSASLNLTNQTLYIWVNFLLQAFLDTWENGGFTCRLSDGTNSSTWYIAGSDRALASGYNRLAFSVNSSPDVVSGSLSISAVTSIVYSFKGIGKSKLPECVFVDFLQYGAEGAGLKVTGGTVDGLDALVTADQSVACGMIAKVNGVYFINGAIVFGDTSSGNLDFKDTNQLVASTNHYRTFTNATRTTAESLVGVNHFTLTVQGNSGGTINFQLGNIAGSDRGVQGCHFKTGGNRRLRLIATDTNLDVFKLYGCTFINFLNLNMPVTASGREMRDCVISSSGQILPSTMLIRYCTIVNTTDVDASMLWGTGINIQDCSFIANAIGAAIEHASATGSPFTYTNLLFIGNTYDVLNSSGSTITVNKSGTANPISYEGTLVNFVGSVLITINVEDIDGGVITDAQTSVFLEASPFTQLMNEDTVSGVASESYSGSTPVSVVVKVRKSETTDSPRYKPYSSIQEIGTSGLTLAVTLEVNPFL